MDVTEGSNVGTRPTTDGVTAEQRSVTAVSVKFHARRWAVGDTDDVVRVHHWCEIHHLPCLIVEAAGPHMEAPDLVRTAGPRVAVGIALVVARGKRQAAADDHGCVP